jgi:hypothetical protein
VAAQVLERGAQTVLELDRQVLDLTGVLGGVLQQPEQHAERDELLLGTVVQVPLDPVAFLVLGSHQPLPRCRQIVDGGPQLNVLREMAQGRGNAGIAAELSLSESSVKKYVNAIFAKLDLASEQLVHRRVAAVLTFLRDAGLRSAG